MVSEMELIESLARRLGPYEKESSSKYKFDCPTCGSAKSLHLNPRKDGGPGICTGCGLRTNSVAILHLKGKETRIVKCKTEVEIDWKGISQICQFIIDKGDIRPSHEKWLLNRGIKCNSSSSPKINSMIVRSSDKVFHMLLENFSAEKLAACGFCILRKGLTPMAPGFLMPNRILIPYLDINTKAVYIRSRYVGIPEFGKYLAPPNIPGFGFSWGWETILPKSNYVIVTEGELKAQATKQLGFPCVALPGMNTGYENIAKSCKIRNIEKAYIIFDTETDIFSNGIPKMQGVRAAVKTLQKVLLGYGIRPIPCELPIINHNKTDLDGFILERGNKSIRELISLMELSDRGMVDKT